jgi:hypothetical protein
MWEKTSLVAKAEGGLAGQFVLFGSAINNCISNFMVSKPLRHTEVRDKSLNSVIIYATIYIGTRGALRA